MKTLKSILLICSALLTLTIAYGQKNNFKNGYIIQMNGDTIKGKIKHQVNTRHSEYVIFKKTNDDEATTYSPADLSKYFFEKSNYYESDSILFMTGDGTIYYRELFVKKLLDGEVELFRLDVDMGESQSIAFDYQSKFYLFRAKGNPVLIDLHENNYKEKLSSAFKSKNCELEKGKNYSFNDEGMTNLVRAYNACLGSSTTKMYVTEKRKSKIRYGISPGIYSSEITTSNLFFEGFEMERELGYEFNFFVLNDLWYGFALKWGLGYRHSEQSGTGQHIVSEFYDNQGEVLNLESSITYNQIRAPIQLQYNFLQLNNTNIYLFAGGAVGGLTKFTSYIDRNDFEFIDGQSLGIKKRIDPFKNKGKTSFETSVLFGLGFDFTIKDKYGMFLDLGYERGKNGATKDGQNYIYYNAALLKLGFFLK